MTVCTCPPLALGHMAQLEDEWERKPLFRDHPGSKGQVEPLQPPGTLGYHSVPGNRLGPEERDAAEGEQRTARRACLEPRVVAQRTEGQSCL